VSRLAGPLEITSSRLGHLWDALCRAYEVLGFADAMGLLRPGPSQVDELQDAERSAHPAA
jgi:hypothetical protein